MYARYFLFWAHSFRPILANRDSWTFLSREKGQHFKVHTPPRIATDLTTHAWTLHKPLRLILLTPNAPWARATPTPTRSTRPFVYNTSTRKHIFIIRILHLDRFSYVWYATEENKWKKGDWIFLVDFVRLTDATAVSTFILSLSATVPQEL